LATYATGLSGGSWLVIAMAANNYPTIPDLFNKIKMDRDLILSGGTILGSMKYFQNILKFVLEKKIAGFQTSMIDYWSVALGQHFLPELSSGSMGRLIISSIGQQLEYNCNMGSK
jgi:lysophospholipase